LLDAKSCRPAEDHCWSIFAVRRISWRITFFLELEAHDPQKLDLEEKSHLAMLNWFFITTAFAKKNPDK
jgi:hypothetical protein